MLRGETIVVTGATGQVGMPVALALAAGNEVVAPARFRSRRARARLEAAGVRCVTADLGAGDLGDVPTDPTFVLNFAVAKTNDWDTDLAANAEGVGLLMAHCRGARAFLHCSTTGVYQDTGGGPYAETDPLGDNHRVSPFMETYSISKIAAETVVRFAAREHDVPTTIARLNVPYGDRGGWPAFHLLMMQGGQPIPVHVDGPTVYTPIHDDDLLRTLPALLDAATVPATTINWAGSEQVSVEEWCTYLGELTGLAPTFEPTDRCLESVIADASALEALAGPSTVPWREGFRHMVATSFPDLLRA